MSDPTHNRVAPLGYNFFQVLLSDPKFGAHLDGFRQHVYVDVLFEEIQPFWHLDINQLKVEPFDIEDCLI